MVFTVAALIEHLSQFMVLSPGDVINTGTPQGVALSGRFPTSGQGTSWNWRSTASAASDRN
jgi:2-keto-4-pentenoate hydratase/2-oxohepta-3-ene-1,7-dioic acid hydratase in catechol pathway